MYISECNTENEIHSELMQERYHIISVSSYTREDKELWSLHMIGTQLRKYKVYPAFCVKNKSYVIH